ncbi:NAD(P)H-dependent oxidoreductase [Poseidonocella sedimentorum]|uniref:NAD(P)H dehydrogenase (Quinone) n=1 Tax=Poseidonocella sedimentorum TaxID=871652 RepID=A0A1I6DT00_9RHOB|nr:NAD(P)H-dependent oxidoreductase [Poseidonocella sedimentorum]SFR08438.1 NAD(P)H dehydrogenase (quinone) [Poseidonocella sedimentorum]
MTRILIVAAHPEPSSFTLTWARETLRAAEALGHEAALIDLHAAGFDPVESAAHYPRRDGPFDPLKAQEDGVEAADVRAQMAQIEAADWLILHFPIYWFAPPAMIKGWCERVLAHGRLHDVENRFDTGPCRGKRALFCVTTGASAAECGPDGKEGNLAHLLWPLAYTLRYCGFDVAEPIVEHGVHGYHSGARKSELEARLTARLRAQQDIMAGLEGRALLRFHPDGDFDDTGRLRPGIAPLSPFIAPPGAEGPDR